MEGTKKAFISILPSCPKAELFIHYPATFIEQDPRLKVEGRRVGLLWESESDVWYWKEVWEGKKWVGSRIRFEHRTYQLIAIVFK